LKNSTTICDALAVTQPGLVTPMESQINRRLIHCRHRDLTADELSRVRSGLAHVPGGSDEKLAALWEKFQANHANLFICRDAVGEIAFFVFFEVLTHIKTSAREFFCGAAYSFVNARDITETTFPQLESFAGMLRCQSVTVRTSRPGLVAKLVRLGYRLHREGDGEWFMVKRLGCDFSNF
jgi:hypothetical protein